MPNLSVIPPGWRRNPSRWRERLPIVLLALLGVGIAGYLALWQYDLIRHAWDPFFKGRDSLNGTEQVLSSRLSKPFINVFGWDWMPFPITDAALGAFAYLLDAATGLWGGRQRWKTMPWIVVLFAVFVGPLGAVSLALVISQPLVEGAWCTLCLASALVSALMIGPAMDEALASCQQLKRVAHDPGKSVWKAFWGYDYEEARWRLW